MSRPSVTGEQEIPQPIGRVMRLEILDRMIEEDVQTREW